MIFSKQKNFKFAVVSHFLRRNERYQYSVPLKSLAIQKKFPESRHKFSGKQKILKPQISRIDLPGRNTTDNGDPGANFS